MSKLAQIKALENGNGIQYLLDAANRVLNNPIVMFDTSYSLIAYTDSLPDDRLWEELISTGTFCMDTQKFFGQECFTEEVANAAGLAILKSNYLKYDRIISYIKNRDNIAVANVLMCERNAFEDEDMVAFEALADKIAAEIRDDGYYTAYAKEYYEVNLRKLLEKVINEPEIYTSHVQILYDGFEDYLYVAVVDLSLCNVANDKNDYIKNMLIETYRTFKITVYEDYIVMVLSSKNPIFDINTFFNINKNPFEQYNLFVGISTSFENLYELREYFDNAVSTLKEGFGKDSGQRFYVGGTTVYSS